MTLKGRIARPPPAQIPRNLFDQDLLAVKIFSNERRSDSQAAAKEPVRATWRPDARPTILKDGESNEFKS